MSKTRWGVSHIETLDQLPAELEKGRAYFVDDEAYIVIDYGQGPVIYGNRPGPAGVSGEPIPQLQDQIDYLTEAVFNILTELHRKTIDYDNAINILAQTVSKLYPDSYSSGWKDNATGITSGEILTTSDGTQYTISQAYTDGDLGVFVLEVPDETAVKLIDILKPGDSVEFSNSSWTVSEISKHDGLAVVELTLQ